MLMESSLCFFILFLLLATVLAQWLYVNSERNPIHAQSH